MHWLRMLLLKQTVMKLGQKRPHHKGSHGTEGGIATHYRDANQSILSSVCGAIRVIFLAVQSNLSATISGAVQEISVTHHGTQFLEETWLGVQCSLDGGQVVMSSDLTALRTHEMVIRLA